VLINKTVFTACAVAWRWSGWSRNGFRTVVIPSHFNPTVAMHCHNIVQCLNNLFLSGCYAPFSHMQTPNKTSAPYPGPSGRNPQQFTFPNMDVLCFRSPVTWCAYVS